MSENYGQVFYFKSKQERQRELEARLAKKTKKITQQPTIDILCISDIGSHASVQLAKKIGHF